MMGIPKHSNSFVQVDIWTIDLQSTKQRRQLTVMFLTKKVQIQNLCTITSAEGRELLVLTFWRRNYFFFNFSTPVYEMWIIQEPNMLGLWNKLHFEEKKAEIIYHV